MSDTKTKVEELRERIADVVSRAEKLGEERVELMRQLRAARAEELGLVSGVTRLIVSPAYHSNRAIFVSVSNFEGSPKPWVRVRMILRDGSVSGVVRDTFSSWELDPEANR